MPAPENLFKKRLLASKANQQALYATEATPVRKADLSSYRSSLADALIGPGHSMRAPRAGLGSLHCHTPGPSRGHLPQAHPTAEAHLAQ